MSTECALVDVDFERLIQNGKLHFGDDNTNLSEYVQPASLDIPVTSLCYLVKDTILPFGTTIREMLPDIVLEEMKLPHISEESKHAPVLLKGHTYLAYCGKVNLPPNMRASLSPKSSIGRIDVMVRSVFDYCGFYDTIENSKASGELWMQISPRSFNIRLRAGLSLSQMMIFREIGTSPSTCLEKPCTLFENCFSCHPPKGNLNVGLHKLSSPLSDSTHELVYDAWGSPLPKQLHNQDLILTLNLAHDHLGFEALSTNAIIDISRLGELDEALFFRPLVSNIPNRDAKRLCKRLCFCLPLVFLQNLYFLI